MNQPQRNGRRRGTELVLFLVASAIGIYGLGRGLTGMFEPGQGISLPWLALTGVALIVLFAQMGRVHDTWPHKAEKLNQSEANEHTAHQSPQQTGER